MHLINTSPTLPLPLPLPLHAQERLARFVSLVPYLPDTRAFAGVCDIWASSEVRQVHQEQHSPEHWASEEWLGPENGSSVPCPVSWSGVCVVCECCSLSLAMHSNS